MYVHVVAYAAGFTCRIAERQRLRRACAYAQSRQSLSRFLQTQSNVAKVFADMAILIE